MDAIEKLSITLPATLARLVREKVAEGTYASNSEVIREALRLWHDREQSRMRRLEEIGRDLSEAMDDPRPSVAADEVFDDIRRLHRAGTRTK
ncbi:MAG: type II toxin-antitoxin system ParD family antitoxin [Rhizobiales bacterium]|nr:type II toxin-antitoxin system ParD family antitoxin [Hyphomicrobiales bacterium]MBN9009992.1 type II toxin-antitoxin system ParD family antitoxin [Hyphomicrobiales bacterium]